MGEARQRATSDPTFGRIPKATLEGKRGIVVSTAYSITDGAWDMTGLDAQELRHALLFWDEIAWPTNPIIHITGGQDEDFLVDAGVIQRPVIQIRSFEDDTFPKIHLEAFNALDAQTPGKWSFAIGEDSRRGGVPAGHTPSIGLELYRAIPVPDVEAPIAEVLEFKLRRRDEILRLRAEIDTLANEVKESADAAVALELKKAHVEQACNDLLRAGIEWKFPIRVSNLKCTFEVSGTQILTAALAAAGAGFVFGMPTLGALIGGAASVLKVTGDISRNSSTARQGPYQYVYSFHEEIF